MDKLNIKKVISVVLSLIAILGFYLIGKSLKMDLVSQFAPYIATMIIGWVVYYGEKWFGLKLEFFNNEFTKGKVVEAIIWAEGKAVEAFKLDKLITEGEDKAKWACAKILETMPNVSEQRAYELIDYYFPQVRPSIEKLWFELAEEMKIKKALEKKKAA